MVGVDAALPKGNESEISDLFSSALLPKFLPLLDEAAYPDRNTRIRVLLAWFGSGAGPWNGYPAYESITEDLLMTFASDELARALEFPGLTDAQLEGTARLLAGWAFRTKRKRVLSLLPEAVKQSLPRHSMASPDEDRRSRAREAFDPVRSR
jgi:hypothetical protein